MKQVCKNREKNTRLHQINCYHFCQVNVLISHASVAVTLGTILRHARRQDVIQRLLCAHVAAHALMIQRIVLSLLQVL